MITKDIGDFGEGAAARYLEDEGYEVIKRNFRTKSGEIDIIAEIDGCIVFVEVKTRKSSRFGEPSEYVDFRKQQRIHNAAAVYADSVNREMRFDVIEVFYEERRSGMEVSKINHIENAF